MSLRRLGVILAHEVRIASRDPLPVLVLLVFPIITMAFLKPAFQPALVQAGHRQANGAEQVVPGQAVMTGFFVVSLITFAFFSEHAGGTWDRLRASAATPLEVVVGKSLPRIVMSITQFVIIFAAGVLLFDLDIGGNPLALVPLVITFAICLVLLGVTVTAICRTAQQANAFAVVGMVIFGAIGGALVPFHVLPGWAQHLAPTTPTYWAMRGFRSVILDDQSLGSIAAPAAILTAMSVAFTLVALQRFRFDEHKVGWI
ncbi:MAG: ABC transporter permease [Acidimicrobiia bacterium]